MSNPAAEIHIFDLDHTLVLKDTFAPFLIGLVKLQPRLACQLPLLAPVWIMFKFGMISNQTAKQLFLQRVVGKSSTEMLQYWCRIFTRQLTQSALNTAVFNQLQRVQKSGAITVLATASPDVYVEQLAKALRFDVVICTRLRRDENGRLSGLLDGNNCYGNEKFQQVSAWLKSNGDKKKSWFYTDHHTDLSLLKAVDHGVMVRPTKALLHAGNKLGLQVLG